MKYLYATIFILLLHACSTKDETVQEATDSTINDTEVILSDAQLKSTKLQLSKIEKHNVSSIIKVNGIIDVPPQNMVSVSMPFGGFLKSTQLLPGMHINKGEIIATMEDQKYIQLQQEYLTTKAKLKFAETENNRQKDLNESKANSDKIYQQAVLDYSTLKISLKALSEELELINIDAEKLTESTLSKQVKIISPISGFVSKVNVNIGKYVNPSDILFELVNPTDIHLNLKIFEKDISKLAIGQKLIAYTNNEQRKRFDCEIILISQDLTNDRSAEVHCHFLKYDKALLPGMYMNAEIEVQRNDAFAIPEDAIVNFEGENFVFVAKSKNQFILSQVEIGAKEDGYIEIINGNEFADKQIVVKDAYTLLMKMKNKGEG